MRKNNSGQVLIATDKLQEMAKRGIEAITLSRKSLEDIQSSKQRKVLWNKRHFSFKKFKLVYTLTTNEQVEEKLKELRKKCDGYDFWTGSSFSYAGNDFRFWETPNKQDYYSDFYNRLRLITRLDPEKDVVYIAIDDYSALLDWIK